MATSPNTSNSRRGRVNRNIKHMVAAGMGQLTSAMKISFNRSSIAQLLTRGVAPRCIAERLKVLPGTIYKIVEQFKEVGHVEEKPKSERLRSVNISRIRRAIKRRIIRSDGVSLNEIASNLYISRGSVQNIVKCELGLLSYRLPQGRTLTDKAKKNKSERAEKLFCHLRASDPRPPSGTGVQLECMMRGVVFPKPLASCGLVSYGCAVMAQGTGPAREIGSGKNSI